jgi:predicted PurR-regulated permease PerM
MKIDFNRKYTTISVYSIITFAICLLMVMIAVRFSTLTGYIKRAFEILAPITWGLVIAYILNPVMVTIEKPIKKLTGKHKPHPRLDRFISITITFIITIAALSALIAIIIPQVLSSVMMIFNNFNEYFTNLENWVNKLLADYPQINQIFDEQFNTIQTKLMEVVDNIIPKIGDFAIKLRDSAIDFILGLKDFIIGFIVAIYVLSSKEKFIAQSKKVSYAIFPKNFSRSFLNICGRTNSTLNGFISGKILDSIIIGLLCFIVIRIMGINFPVLISVIVGVTNVIPFFGPIFGAIPCALLLLMTSPKQVIPFIIFIIILQQFDGNVLGPKILGETTGLPAFWVLFSILIGGGLFGFAGMILGVPVFAVLYTLVGELTNYLLLRKELSVNTDDYQPAQKTDGFIRHKNKQPQSNLFGFNLVPKKTEQKPESSDNQDKQQDIKQ